MNKMEFVKGMGIGMIAGAAVGTMLAPKKQGKKSTAGKALRAAGDIIDSVSHAIGL